MREGVVFVEQRAHDDEGAEAKEDAEDEFPGARELGGDEQGERDAEHHYVGGEVEDCVCDEVVDCC